MAYGWGVIQAGLSAETARNAAQELDIPASKAFRQTPDQRQDEQDLEVKMLPADKEFYLSGLGRSRGIKQQVLQQVQSWWMEHDQAPPPEVDRSWKERLAQAEVMEARTRTYRPFLEGRYQEYFNLMDRINAPGEASTAGSFAVVEREGVFETLLGQKSSGAIGWLTPREVLQVNAGTPGVDGHGMALDLDFPVNTGYSGAFARYVNSTLESASRYILPSGEGISERAPDVLGEGVRYMQDVVTTTNAPDLAEAAGKLYQSMPRAAREDLMSNHFFQDLLRVGYDPGDKARKTLIMPFASAQGMGLRFSAGESEVIHKFMNGKALTAAERSTLGSIQQDYAREMILSMVPSKRRVNQDVRLIKLSPDADGDNGQTGNKKKGFYTLIGLGELKSDTPATVLVRNDSVLSESTPRTPSGQGLLRRWTDVNPSERARFNADAVDLLKEASGLDPTYFSGDFNFFYTQRGHPNPLATLRQTRSAVVALTGRVQENFIPDQDQEGFKPVEVSRATVDNLRKRLVTTVEVEVAIPQENISDFGDMVMDIDGVKSQGIDTDNMVRRSYLIWEEGEKVSRDYYLVKLWMPVSEGMMPSLDDPARYAEGTYQARRENELHTARQRRETALSLKEHAKR